MADFFLDGFYLRKKPNTGRLFLAEGPSEVGYHLEVALALKRADPQSTTILCFKGVNKMARHSRTIVKFIEPSMVQQLRAIGVIADCEDSPKGRLDAIIACGKAFGFNRCAADLNRTGQHTDNNRKFAVSLSPSGAQPGRIETLVLQEISENETMKCIAATLGCISAANNGRQVNEKAQVQMFISAAMNNSMAGIRNAFLARLLDVTADAYKAHLAMVDFILA
jgi:hypothetical protein